MDWPLIWSTAAALVALGLVQGVPRLFRSIYRWTSAALFSALPAGKRRVGMVMGAAAAAWAVIVVGSVYTPLTLAFAPQVVPLPGGIVRQIVLLDLGLLLIAIPLLVGGGGAIFQKGTLSTRILALPLAFVHIIGLALALVVLIPWIAARWVILRIRRYKEEQHRIDIDEHMYDTVTDALISVVRSAGLTAHVSELPRPVRLSRALIDRAGPPVLRSDAPYEARRLHGDGFDILIFSSLIDIVADGKRMSRLRRCLVGRLPPSGMWLTTSDEARELERDIREGRTPMHELQRRLAEIDVSLEEWRALNFEYMQVLVRRVEESSPDTHGPASSAGPVMPVAPATPPTRAASDVIGRTTQPGPTRLDLE